MAQPTGTENAFNVIFRFVVFTLGLALGAIAQAFAQLATPAPGPQPAPVSTETTAPSRQTAVPGTQPPLAQPTALPSPAPTAAPPTATPVPATPAPSATPASQSPYKYVVEPSPDPAAAADLPQIVRIELNDQTIHPGGQFAVRVTTSANTTRVFASAEGHDIEIPRAQPGLFAGLTTIPTWIPPMFFKTYQVTFTALTVDNKRSTFVVPIALGR